MGCNSSVDGGVVGPGPVRIVFVLGGPGTGKGTQCTKAAEEYGLAHISSGDLLRAEVASGSDKGKELEGIMASGKLVPTEDVIDLMKAAVDERVAGGANGILIDGFPRELSQVTAFESKFARSCNFVVFFEASEEVMTARLLERGKTSGRADDNEESILKRLRTYNEKTAPVIALFEEQGTLRRINAERPIETVYLDVQQLVK